LVKKQVIRAEPDAKTWLPPGSQPAAIGTVTDGTIATADGDFGGTRGSQATFASSAHVKLDTFSPGHGQGAAYPPMN
jgi:hypothetical protein